MIDMSQPQWYILQTQYGYETIVENEINELMQSEKYSDVIFKVVVPREIEVKTLKSGKKKRVEKPKFAGYAFVKMIYSKQTWWAVKSTRGVVRFCSDAKNIPVPMRPEEVKRSQLEEVKIEDLLIKVGDQVTIITGPFKDLEGEVLEIKPDTQQVKVKVLIYGRPTNMNLDFAQVEKIKS